ncbi:prepilin-type N-terminal cleavage/methylation domain-containing protein [Candidatus Falkowbacteria bacterium]|nr:prepilin-type N-terminal cleavage/methylation domain-containing protein [Candidatus Falkowbacteria bacterium]
MSSRIIKNKNGFTLLETMVSLALFTIIIILVSDVYLVTQQAYNKNSDLAEITQNARVSLDRISRELRQSASIITTLPETDTDPENPPAGQIIFQDGHETSQTTYLKYYLNGTDLIREHKAYYFEEEPTVYVTYNSVDQGGFPPLENILSRQIVGEYFTELGFWGGNGLVNLNLSLAKNQHTFAIKTSVFSRNR